MICNIIFKFAVEFFHCQMMEIISKYDISEFETAVRSAERIAVTAHMRPDGDAVGSCTALYHCIKDMGRQAVIVLPDKAPGYLSFITETIGRGDLVSHEDDPAGAQAAISGCDLLFSLDYNAFHRTGKMEPLLDASKARKILIDHHLNPSRELFDLAFSETQVSSTAEYLFYILMGTGAYSGGAESLPADAATALMTGMTTDTNNFANSVFPSTLRMASALLEAGVDRDMIITHLYNEYREERIRLLGKLLSEGLRITDDGVGYIVLSKKMMDRYGLQEGETEGFVNIPLSIGKVKMSCFFKEDEDRIRVSIRSKRGISANRCATLYFHGGGHEQAAGGRLSIPDDVASVDDVAAYAEKVTGEFMKSQQR